MTKRKQYKFKPLTVAETEPAYAKTYGPGGSYHMERYSLSTLRRYLKAEREALPKAKGKDAARIRGTIMGLEACIELLKPDAKFGNRVTYRQEGGDDGYQYVVRVDGRAKWSGLTRTEAAYYKQLEVTKLKEAS